MSLDPGYSILAGQLKAFNLFLTSFYMNHKILFYTIDYNDWINIHRNHTIQCSLNTNTSINMLIYMEKKMSNIASQSKKSITQNKAFKIVSTIVACIVVFFVVYSFMTSQKVKCDQKVVQDLFNEILTDNIIKTATKMNFLSHRYILSNPLMK
jgi:predicted PurR-regulated permease PerM